MNTFTISGTWEPKTAEQQDLQALRRAAGGGRSRPHGLGESKRPVLQAQARHPFELPLVVRDQSQVVCKGDGGNLGIVRTNRLALPGKIGANLAELLSRLAGEGNARQPTQERE